MPHRPAGGTATQAKDVLANKIDKDDVLFLLGKKFGFNIHFAIRLAKLFGLGFGQMAHTGDYTISISKLTKWLGQIAKTSRCRGALRFRGGGYYR